MNSRSPSPLRQKMREVIFESSTRAGRLFDLVLMLMIVASLLVVVMDSVESFSRRHHLALTVAEWTFTGLFTLEYLARLYCAPRRLRYAGSFYGVIDLMALLPTYLALFFPGLHALIDIRVLRLLRVFRVLKLTQYLREFSTLGAALSASRRKILVFLFAVSMVVLVMGTVMYVVEGPANGYTSIPVGVYWAITTMTTVGFGDITPKTDLGRLIASMMMLMGWGVLAVPTGIVTAEMVQRRGVGARHAPDADPDEISGCPRCGGPVLMAHDRFCRHCGLALHDLPLQDAAKAAVSPA